MHVLDTIFFQILETFGAVRTIADVDDEELLVGTTRNAILRGTFSDGFVAIVQVFFVLKTKIHNICINVTNCYRRGTSPKNKKICHRLITLLTF